MRGLSVLPRFTDGCPQDSTALSTAPESDAGDQLVDLVEDHVALGHLLLDLVDGVHDRRVVAAAKGLGDAGIAQVGELPHDVHTGLAGGDEGATPALAADVVD